MRPHYTAGTDAWAAKLNVGILTSVVLVILLIFMELTRPVLAGRTVGVLGRLRLRFSTMTWMLFIIFMGIVYTMVVMMLTA